MIGDELAQPLVCLLDDGANERASGRDAMRCDARANGQLELELDTDGAEAFSGPRLLVCHGMQLGVGAQTHLTRRPR